MAHAVLFIDGFGGYLTLYLTTSNNLVFRSIGGKGLYPDGFALA